MVDMDRDQMTSLMVIVVDHNHEELDMIFVNTENECHKELVSNPPITTNNSSITPSKTSLYLLPRQASAFSHLLHSSPLYRHSALLHWSSPALPTLLTVKLNTNTIQYLDHNGCHMAQALLWEMIELEDALHWLSTLGGAFSNLGEHNPKFAVKAGTNALKQLVVAMRCGDKTVEMRCWLFIGQSLLQQCQFRQAARVIRLVWSCCHQPPLVLLSCTAKLLNMCRGVWARLRHERRIWGNQWLGMDADCVEVEQKFTVPDNYKTMLESAGAHLVSEKTLSDTYMDTEDLILLRRDVWLRRRGALWELKVPAGKDQRNTCGMTQYSEVTGRKEVEREVIKFTEIEMDKMMEMVKVVAVRESWVMGEFNVVIDRLDNDNWSVGEVEILVKSQTEVEKARRKVQEAGIMLGFSPQENGKVEHCLRTQNPGAAAVLEQVRRKAADDGDNRKRIL